MTVETSAERYSDVVRTQWSDTRIWDYVRYDEEGRLWIHDLCVPDAVEAYGSPLEVVDTSIVARRCAEWRELVEDAARAVGYPARTRYLYAAKANMASEVAHAAYRSGWGAETSARQDLEHLRWMHEHELLPKDIRVVCNGFKLPPDRYARPSGGGASSASSASNASNGSTSVLRLPRDSVTARVRSTTYAEAILAAARDGWDICPIFDEGEIDTFLRPGAPRMKVGLRMKHGPVSSREDLGRLVSRFGMDLPTLRETARRVADADHLDLCVLHAMVGAATTIPVDTFVDALLLAGDVWCDLRAAHGGLRELNIGGGVPPLSEPYDHTAFVTRLLGGLARHASRRGVPAPDVTFELGALVAAECGFHVFRVLQDKRNHQENDEAVAWAIVDGGLMAAIPDMLLLDKSFRILAAEGAHAPARAVRLGDLTCDADGRYPPEAFGAKAHVLLPRHDGPQHIVVLGVGAYQEILSGVRGAHHCGLLEAVELIIEPDRYGAPRARLMPRQTSEEAASLLGYTDESVPALRDALAFACTGRGGA